MEFSDAESLVFEEKITLADAEWQTHGYMDANARLTQKGWVRVGQHLTHDVALILEASQGRLGEEE